MIISKKGVLNRIIDILVVNKPLQQEEKFTSPGHASINECNEMYNSIRISLIGPDIYLEY